MVRRAIGSATTRRIPRTYETRLHPSRPRPRCRRTHDGASWLQRPRRRTPRRGRQTHPIRCTCPGAYRLHFSRDSVNRPATTEAWRHNRPIELLEASWSATMARGSEDWPSASLPQLDASLMQAWERSPLEVNRQWPKRRMAPSGFGCRPTRSRTARRFRLTTVQRRTRRKGRPRASSRRADRGGAPKVVGAEDPQTGL